MRGRERGRERSRSRHGLGSRGYGIKGNKEKKGEAGGVGEKE